jgi:hypothetical protein
MSMLTCSFFLHCPIVSLLNTESFKSDEALDDKRNFNTISLPTSMGSLNDAGESRPLSSTIFIGLLKQ